MFLGGVIYIFVKNIEKETSVICLAARGLHIFEINRELSRRSLTNPTFVAIPSLSKNTKRTIFGAEYRVKNITPNRHKIHPILTQKWLKLCEMKKVHLRSM
jgi:hypothetical protein